MIKQKVIVGMSGGVDSSVAAYLLLKKGYEVVGVTMQTGSDAGGDVVISDARHICEQLGIEHIVLDFTAEFDKYVKAYFVEEYLRGHTPNPCTVCNHYVKWQALLDRFDELGADYVATGHYANIVKLDNGRYALKTADSMKDQTYALYRLTQSQLAKTMMPLGSYDKSQVREIAKEAGLDVFDKPDSMEICFIPDHDYAKYIEEYTGKEIPEGNFVTPDGSIVGTHKGITHYTVGQRKGLGIAFGKPMFVSEIRPETNEVVLSEGNEVFRDELIAEDINAMAVENLRDENGIKARAKVRYSNRTAPCTIYPYGETGIRVRFDENVRAITPGQSVVFYDDEGIVIGGGVIQ